MNQGTLAGTVDWLEKNLGGAACVVFEMGPSRDRLERISENTEVRFDGCQMTLHQATVSGSLSELRTLTVPLGALTPDGVTLSEGFNLPSGWVSTGDVPTHTIRLAVAPGERQIEARLERFDVAAPSRYQTASVDILVRHQEAAERILAALSHAIALCREQR